MGLRASSVGFAVLMFLMSGPAYSDSIDGILGCQLHENSDRSGVRFFVPAEEYSHTLEKTFNDKASSVFVSDGCTIDVYEHANEGGAKVSFGSGVHDLAAAGFNDKASSAYCSCGGRKTVDNYDRCMLFEHAAFGGSSQGLPAREFFGNGLFRLSSFNDKASSLLVCKGCRAILYEHDSYEGSSKELGEGLHPFLGGAVGFDDKTSSVKCVN